MCVRNDRVSRLSKSNGQVGYDILSCACVCVRVCVRAYTCVPVCMCEWVCACACVHVCWHVLDAIVEVSIISIYLFVPWHMIKTLNKMSSGACLSLMLSLSFDS